MISRKILGSDSENEVIDMDQMPNNQDQEMEFSDQENMMQKSTDTKDQIE